MDGLAAFNLASSVIQVIDFSTKIVVKCHELYKYGASTENKEIESMAKHLTELATDLELPNTIQSPRSAPQLYRDDEELVKLGQQCSETAAELLGEVQKLSIQGRRRKRDAFRKAVKGIRKQSAIGDIQRRLGQYRMTLNTRILVNLRQYAHLIAIEHSDGFRDVDHKVQNLIIGLRKDQNSFDEVKDLIKAETALSKDHFSQEFLKHREIVASKDSYHRILESLFFRDIHARYEEIEKAHQKTFEWIFDKSDDKVHPWHNFSDWLENGHGTYWISGKAGSGKSTLMSLICQDHRIEKALKVWSKADEIFMPKFFFWSPGTQLQKSLTGLLRSLIYQILMRFPDLMPVLAKSMSPSQHELHQLPTWTEQRLRTALQGLSSDGLERCHLCVFIDGLDEFHGNQATLLDLIKDLRQTKKIKFCVSSRPEPMFKYELGSSPMLKLQDLTDPDIRKYVSDKLQGVSMNASQIPYSFRIKTTADTIVQKAEGVFLWVSLAVRDQLEGARKGDDAEQLRERLQVLPTEIEELYGHMLRGIDKIYRPQAAGYIRSVLNANRLSLFGFALTHHKRLDDILLFSPDVTISDISQHCKSIGEKVSATCKGFLEVRETMTIDQWQKEKESRAFSKTMGEMLFYRGHPKVEFFHRTALDFFLDNEQGKEFLNAYTLTHPHPRVSHVKVNLAELIVYFTPHKRYIQEYIESLMSDACFVEKVTGVAQVALMDLLDRSVTILYQRSRDQKMGSHWATVWGYPDFNLQGLPIPSNLRVQSTIEPGNDNMAPYPVDFLGFTARFGLRLYVEQKLDSQSNLRIPSTKDYLLNCAVDGLTKALAMQPSSRQLDLISALLKRGANPHRKTANGSIWSFFLCEIYSKHKRLFKDPSWIHTLRAFLDCGVDVNERILFTESLRPDQDMSHLVCPTPFTVRAYATTRHLSALSVLQQCFASSPNFFEIESACVAAGAFPSERVTFSFLVDDGQHDCWIHLKLSEEKSRPFSHHWRQRINTFDSKDFSDSDLKFKDNLVELFNNINIKEGFEQARWHEAARGQSMRRGRSQENSSSNDTKDITHEPSIDSPDIRTLISEHAEQWSHCADYFQLVIRFRESLEMYCS